MLTNSSVSVATDDSESSEAAPRSPAPGAVARGGLYTSRLRSHLFPTAIDTPMRRGFTSDSLHSALSAGSTILDVAGGLAAPMPFASVVVGGAVRVLQVVERARTNRKDIVQLSEEIGGFVLVVARRSSDPPSPRVEEMLQGTLVDIEQFLYKHLTRGRISRFLLSKQDAATVQEYRRRVRNALDVLDVSSQLLIHDSLANILAELKSAQSQRETPTPTPTSTPEPARSWGNMYNTRVADQGRVYSVPIGGGVNSGMHFGDRVVYGAAS